MGRWEEIKHEIWDTVVTPCDCCGQVVARHMWIAEVNGVQRQFCSPGCEELYAIRGHDAAPGARFPGPDDAGRDADRRGQR
jgi:hypothetical protein